MKPKYDFYCAGAMHGRTVGEVLSERDKAQKLCDFYDLSMYNPAADEGLDDLPLETVIDSKPDLELMRHYVYKDETNLSKCKALLVLTGDMNSSGVLWEMGMAFWELHIPIFLVAPLMSRGELTNFTTIKADFICGSQEEAISLLANYLSIKGE